MYFKEVYQVTRGNIYFLTPKERISMNFFSSFSLELREVYVFIRNVVIISVKEVRSDNSIPRPNILGDRPQSVSTTLPPPNSFRTQIHIASTNLGLIGSVKRGYFNPVFQTFFIQKDTVRLKMSLLSSSWF